MGPKHIAAGLFVAWAVHDLEEILGTPYWRDKVVPRLRERHPRVPPPLLAGAQLTARLLTRRPIPHARSGRGREGAVS